MTTDPAVDRWLAGRPPELGAMATHWFAQLRKCGPGIRELLHDGHPTVCIGDAALAYVNVFTAHVNVGFFLGSQLPDPKNLLQGTGKLGRHVKLKPGVAVDEQAIQHLIAAAYRHLDGLLG